MPEDVKQTDLPTAPAQEDVDMLDQSPPAPPVSATPVATHESTGPPPVVQETSTSKPVATKSQPVASEPPPVNWLLVQPEGGSSSKPIKRENGKGVETPVRDPRGPPLDYDNRISDLVRRKKIPIRDRLERVKYAFDEYSCGTPPPPPPSGIVVTNLSRLVTSDKIRAHFARYGEIEEFEYCCDKATGGFLGVCRVKFVDKTIRTQYRPGRKPKQVGERGGQDGHVSARSAMEKNHRQKIITLASHNEDGTYEPLRVVFDADGEVCKQEVRRALDIKYKRAKPQEHKPTLQKTQATPVPASPLPSKPKLAEPPLARRDPVPAGDRFLPRKASEDPSERPQAHRSSPGKPAPRGPFRLQPTSSRRTVDSYVPRGRRRNSDYDRSGSESDTASNADSEDNSRRWKDDDDRIYDHRSRVTRRQIPPARPVDISKEDRFRIAAMDRLARQPHQYIWLEKKDLEHTSAVHKMAVQGHFRPHYSPIVSSTYPYYQTKTELSPFQQVFDDCERWYITFQSGLTARRCYSEFAAKPLGNVTIQLHLEDPPSLRNVTEVEIAARARAAKAAERAAEEKAKDFGVHLMSQAASVSSTRQEPAETHLFVRGVVQQAKSLIIKDLETSFGKDLRQRLATPYVTAAWNSRDIGEKIQTTSVQSSPSRTVQAKHGSQSGTETETKVLGNRSHSQPKHASDEALEEAQTGSVQTNLPTFGKQEKHEVPQTRDARDAARAYALKRQSKTPAPQDQTSIVNGKLDKKDMVMQPDTPSITAPVLADIPNAAADLRREAGVAKKSRSPRKGSKKTLKAIEVLHFTSSEEDSEEEDVPLSQVAKEDMPTEKSVDKIADALKEGVPVKVEEIQAEEEAVLLVPSTEKGNTAPLEAVIHLPTPAPSDSVASSTKRELSESREESAKRPRLTSSASPEAVSPSVPLAPILPEEPPAAVKRGQAATRKAAARGRGKGKRGGKQRKKASATPAPEIDPLAGILAGIDQEDMFYLKIALQRQKAGLPLPPTDLPEEVEEDEDIQVVEPRHETGCARTEGYYKIPQAEKLRYLLARNQGKAESNKEGNSSLSVSRLARVNARHLASGLDKHKKATATDTDLLQLNQLQTRKKQLRFARSPIHDWGLYALEHIPAGEMVIEYVGEQIRQQVADKREKAYERQGIGSSYLL